MAGRSPQTGEPIRRVGGDGSRVAGIDITFSAPKSVSALWAVSDPYRRAQIEVAHRRAVESSLARIERDVELVRRRNNGQLRWQHARSLVAAEFVHTSSRLTRDQERDGVPDPQLHSHLLVLAAERQDGSFAAVDSRELYRSARVSGAWYRAELAYGLGELGVEVRGQTGHGGKYFEVASVPDALLERWSRRSEVIERAAGAFSERYGRAPRAGELSALTVATRGTKTIAADIDVSSAWRGVAEEYGFGQARAENLFTDRVVHQERDVRAELLADATSKHAMVEARELDARALELAAGAERPQAAREHVEALTNNGELVPVEGGLWTTREHRDLEQQALATATERTHDTSGEVSTTARAQAITQANTRLPGGLSQEQGDALDTITGRGGIVVLIGEAGTGKGVVLSTAREAWERDGYRVIGTAVAGAAAQRLATDTNMKETMTADALLHRADQGRIELNERSVVVLDEAGMADTGRLAAIIELTSQADAKLVLAGDAAQLSSIGAGGLFEQIQDRVPSAQLTEVYRAHHEWEREAWGSLRQGDAQDALANYQAHGRLHLEETRTDAGERMVADWAATREAHPDERVVMITDASNAELDRLNEQAQEHRDQAGELGFDRVPLPDRPYALASGDEILFAAQQRVPGERRVENGTRGVITAANERAESVTVTTDEPTPREIPIKGEELGALRLAYAQHVYKAQGLTTDRALVLTGGWQSDREHAYVALSRAREQTDIYAARDELGHEGLDSDAIDRLANRISESRAQQASITRSELEPRTSQDHAEHSRFADRLRDALDNANARATTAHTTDREPTRFSQELHDALNQDLDQTIDHDRGEGIDL